jgi:2,3-dihydroxybiphenyl 1,2-dioxygenase
MSHQPDKHDVLGRLYATAPDTCTLPGDLFNYATFERMRSRTFRTFEAHMDHGLTALGYVGVRSAKPEEWEAFATRLLGMQKVDRAGAVQAFRMDDRKQRLVVTGDHGEGLAFLGWEVSSAHALDALAARLDAHGIEVQRAPRTLADERHVADLIVFHDPEGNRLEAFHGPAVASDPFRPGRAISGFRTGPLGMGHVVMHVADVAKLKPFYCGLLGFRATDYGKAPYELSFFHINGRHHSFAMFASGHSALHHLMVELYNLDDVGQGYDLAELEDGRVAATLGRHTNDHMTSFYAHTPSNFFVEYGWGGRVIEPETWQSQEVHGGFSLWGHDRLYLSAAQRATQRDMRLALAARGQQAPVTVPDCQWLKAVTADA